MAYSKESINDMLSRVVRDLDISEEMFQKAKNEYNSLGNWIEKQTNYEISIYPQGSFALGTVIKPISGDDDYDLDLVCELSRDYGLSAKELKLNVSRTWLETYKRIINIKNKRCCWQVRYEGVPNFHMDVVPAYSSGWSGIEITKHDEDYDTYSYKGSNPKGYIDWFYSRCKERWDNLFLQYSVDNKLQLAEAEVQKLDRNKVKTPLQKVVQLLKRHRDIMYEKLPESSGKNKPISIIITTIAAQLYNNEDNIVDTLDNFLDNAALYILNHKRNDQYYIDNPSFPGENFADKWNEKPERAKAFFDWLQQAKNELRSDSLHLLERVGMGKRISESFGEKTGKRVFSSLVEELVSGIKDGTTKVDTSSGSLSKTGTVTIKSNHHYHAKISED